MNQDVVKEFATKRVVENDTDVLVGLNDVV